MTYDGIRVTKVETAEIVELVTAALAADYSRVRKVGRTIATKLEESDADAARALRSALNRRGVPLQASGYLETLPVDAKSRLPLIEEQAWPATPLFVDRAGQDVFSAFIADAKNVELLASKGIASRLSLLLSGPPGTGKTLLAGHIAAQLGRQLYVVRLDSAISSLLGDTAKNIRSIFDYVPGRDAVLFLDELDAVAKMRDDKHELGELKRVVNTVLQGLDSLDDRAIVIAATNHASMLDPAIWRRFPYRLDLELPGASVRAELWKHYLGGAEEVDTRYEILSKVSEGLTGADIERLALAGRRLALLDGAELDLASIVWNCCHLRAEVEFAAGRNGLSVERKKQLAMLLVKKIGVSQAEVSRLIGVTRQAVSNYLRGSGDGDGDRITADTKPRVGAQARS